MTMMMDNTSNNIEILEKVISCLGKGFDVTSDFRLKFCKGKDRLIILNEDDKKEMVVPGFGSLKDVSVDIKYDKGDRIRHQSGILNFNQMSEFFNQKSSLQGKIPSGYFNSSFNFQSNSWGKDAGRIKYLGLDGYDIILFNIHIQRYSLLLSSQVCNDVPSSWDPPALARFIEKYGTHIVVGLSIGGQEIVLVKQDNWSALQPSELKQHLDELGSQLFTGACTFSPKTRPKNKDHRQFKAPSAFKVFDSQPLIPSDSCGSSLVSEKDGITVICSKRGGDPYASTHCEWLPTVPSRPDAVQFSFIPITSLLKGVPGQGFLSHAINLYLRYKPPISHLQYFLDFQYHRVWVPIHNDQPLAPVSNMSALPTSVFRVKIMGPKLYVNTSQVMVENSPVTGMRLYLEGMKCNRLAIHLQHLTNMPTMLQNHLKDTAFWRGSNQTMEHEKYIEAIKRNIASCVCTAPVKYNDEWAAYRKDVITYIVTGAQLCVKKHGSKKVIHLYLRFSELTDFAIVESVWSRVSSDSLSQKSGLLSAFSTSLSGSLEKHEKEQAKLIIVDSAVFPTGPPVPIQSKKLLHVVDTCQISMGPQDSPGYWLVTGAKLNLEKGKIGLHVKFSLLNRSVSESTE